MTIAANCQARQFSDSMVCQACELVWDMNDPFPPFCKTDKPKVPAMVSNYANFPYIERITVPGVKETYLTRIHLTPFRWWPWSRMYLHIFGRPDEDRELHDHPWGFTTVVLWGGYDEISHELTDTGQPSNIQVKDRLGLFSVRRRPATHAHRITRLHTKRVVTFIIRDNKRVRQWGFWVPGTDLYRRLTWTWKDAATFLGKSEISMTEKY